MNRVLALVVLLVLGLVSACGGSSSGGSKESSPADRLQTAQKYLDAAKGVTIDLSTPELPQGVQGIRKATGLGTKAPAFKGDISVVQSGLSVEVPVTAVDGDTYIKFGGSYQKIDPSNFGAPDPASLFKSGGGLSSLIGDAKSPKKGKDTRDGKEVLSTITASLPGSTVKSVIPSAGSADFAATYTLDSKDHLVSAKVKGPFYPDADDVTYTIDFSKYGDTETISAP